MQLLLKDTVPKVPNKAMKPQGDLLRTNTISPGTENRACSEVESAVVTEAHQKLKISAETP